MTGSEGSRAFVSGAFVHRASHAPAPRRRRWRSWPLALALLLALALHVRLLYRSGGAGRPALPTAGSVEIRMMKAEVSATDVSPSVVAASPLPLLPPPARPTLTLATPQAAASAASVAAAPPAKIVAAATRAASAIAARAAPASAAASAAPRAAAIATGTPGFSMGRLLDLIGIPLEAGNNAPERNYTGANELPAAPGYLTNEQFETGPQPTAEVPLMYPPLANGRSGVVVLRLLINEQGFVDNAAVIKATPPDVFDTAAIIAFMTAQFAPATLQGGAVKSQITIEVEFAPNEP